MEINIQKTANNVVAALIGSFDTQAALEAEPQIKEIEALCEMPLIVDCTALEYIASSGLRALLRMRKAAAAKGNKVTLQGVNTNIMEVLQVTHFDKMFEFC